MAVITASNNLFDATKRFEDSKKAKELDKEASKAVADATRELRAVITGAAAEYQNQTDAINEDIDARLAAVRAMSLEDAERNRNIANLERERAARQAVIDATRAKSNEDFERNTARNAEDADINALGTRDSRAAEAKRQQVGIERVRDDALRDAAMQYAAGSVELARAQEIITTTAQKNLDTLSKTTQLEATKALFQDLKQGFSTLFSGSEEDKKAFFVDLLFQLGQAMIMAKLFGTTMGDAFSNFGGGGASGGLLGSIFGAMGKGAGGGGMGGGLGGIFGSVLSLFGKSGGGPMMGNRPYLVGEQGPELFVPPQNGSLVTNSRLGGGGSNYNINGGGVVVNINGNAGNLNAGALASDIARQNTKAIEAVARKIDAGKGR